TGRDVQLGDLGRPRQQERGAHDRHAEHKGFDGVRDERTCDLEDDRGEARCARETDDHPEETTSTDGEVRAERRHRLRNPNSPATMARHMDWVLLAISLVVILGGSELFTNSVEWIGEGFGLSEGAVGSVLAAVGTALPETILPIIAIISGQSAGQ